MKDKAESPCLTEKVVGAKLKAVELTVKVVSAEN